MAYYQRTRNLFDPKSREPFKFSRSKLELFVRCPRCFYLDRRLGISQPQGPAFTLNSAVDALLKKEFDLHRVQGTAHPLMTHYHLSAKPFEHKKIDEWRDTFKGVGVLHPATNFWFYGAVDDIWELSSGELAIVDYKATSTTKEISLDDEWKQAYKRQMEIYQWLARHNPDLKEYKISDNGYFVYCNGTTDRQAFDGKLEFSVEIIPYLGHDVWVEKELIKARQCLESPKLPEAAKNCEYCQYVDAAAKESRKLLHL